MHGQQYIKVTIVAFAKQQWLHEGASMLRRTYWGADKSLDKPGRKPATATKL
jgi:hypothetical protein